MRIPCDLPSLPRNSEKPNVGSSNKFHSDTTRNTKKFRTCRPRRSRRDQVRVTTDNISIFLIGIGQEHLRGHSDQQIADVDDAQSRVRPALELPDNLEAELGILTDSDNPDRRSRSRNDNLNQQPGDPTAKVEMRNGSRGKHAHERRESRHSHPTRH